MSASEQQARRQRLLERLPELRVEAFLISSLPNIRYLSGFTGSNALLLVAHGDSILFTDPRYTIQSRQETDCRVQIAKASVFDAAAKLITKRRWKRIGVEQGRITYAAYMALS